MQCIRVGVAGDVCMHVRGNTNRYPRYSGESSIVDSFVIVDGCDELEIYSLSCNPAKQQEFFRVLNYLLDSS